MCGEELAGKKPSGRVELTVFVCSRECVARFDQARRDTIVKSADVCQANTKAITRR